MFYKNGKLIFIKKNIIDDHEESQESYILRCMFIISQNIKNEIKYNEIIKLSIIYANIKLLNCSYDKKIIDKIKLLEQNMYSE